MYVVSRVMSFQKGTYSSFVERLVQPSAVNEFPGFVRKEIWVNDKGPDIDIVRVHIYWISKDAHLAWEKSPVHIAQHRAHAGQPRPVEIVETRHETYTLIEPVV